MTAGNCSRGQKKNCITGIKMQDERKNPAFFMPENAENSKTKNGK